MRRLGAGLSALALLGGCTAPADPPAAAPEPAPELEVEVLQYRRDVARRVVQLQVTNAGTAEITVRRVELVAPGFAPLGPVPKDYPLPPGRTVDFAVDLGEAVCDERPDAPTVRVLTDGTDDPVEPRLLDARALATVHGRECAERAVRRQADIGWDDAAWRVTGAGEGVRISGVLRVEPLGESVVRLVEVTGTTLFTAAATGLPLELAPDGGPAAVPVELGPQRCDGHAIGESKRGFAFGVRVQAGGDAEALVTVEPDAATQPRLMDALLQRCALA